VRVEGMNENEPTRDSMIELSEETRKFLSQLSRDDIKTLESGLPLIRQVLGFGKVMTWLAIFVLSILAGIVLLGESVSKIIGWIKP